MLLPWDQASLACVCWLFVDCDGEDGGEEDEEAAEDDLDCENDDE